MVWRECPVVVTRVLCCAVLCCVGQTLLQSRLRHTEEQNARLGSELRQGETARKALAEELENEKEKAARQTETMQVG